MHMQAKLRGKACEKKYMKSNAYAGKVFESKYMQKRLRERHVRKSICSQSILDNYMQSNTYAANLKQNLNKHKEILNVMFLSIYVDIYMMCCCNEHENEVELHFLKRRV